MLNVENKAAGRSSPLRRARCPPSDGCSCNGDNQGRLHGCPCMQHLWHEQAIIRSGALHSWERCRGPRSMCSPIRCATPAAATISDSLATMTWTRRRTRDPGNRCPTLSVAMRRLDADKAPNEVLRKLGEDEQWFGVQAVSELAAAAQGDVTPGAAELMALALDAGFPSDPRNCFSPPTGTRVRARRRRHGCWANGRRELFVCN